MMSAEVPMTVSIDGFSIEADEHGQPQTVDVIVAKGSVYKPEYVDLCTNVFRTLLSTRGQRLALFEIKINAESELIARAVVLSGSTKEKTAADILRVAYRGEDPPIGSGLRI
jgi:hypothetical protein